MPLTSRIFLLAWHSTFPTFTSVGAFVFSRWSRSNVILRNKTVFASMSNKYEVVFVLGGPGSGKGTLCAQIVEKYGFVHLSAGLYPILKDRESLGEGDLLREERNDPGSEYGELIEGHIVNGTIVPVSITCSLLEKAMAKNPHNRFLIDGFPRNEDNLQGWDKSMASKTDLKFVLFLDCDEDTCVRRCLARGAAGSGRSDDNLESLKKRFKTYQSSTMGIVKKFEEKNLVKRIDATQSIDQVFEQVQIIFEKVFPDLAQ